MSTNEANTPAEIIASNARALGEFTMPRGNWSGEEVAVCIHTADRYGLMFDVDGETYRLEWGVAGIFDVKDAELRVVLQGDVDNGTAYAYAAGITREESVADHGDEPARAAVAAAVQVLSST